MKLHMRFWAAALALLTVFCLGLGGCADKTQTKPGESTPQPLTLDTGSEWRETLTETQEIKDLVYVAGIFSPDRSLPIFLNIRPSPRGIFFTTIPDRESGEQVVWEFDPSGHFLQEYPVSRPDYIDRDGSFWNLENRETKGGTRESSWIDYTVTHTMEGEKHNLLELEREQSAVELLLIPGGFALQKTWWDEGNKGHFSLELYDQNADLRSELELEDWYVNTVRDGEDLYFFGREGEILRLDPQAPALVEIGRLDGDCSSATVAGGVLYESDEKSFYRRAIDGVAPEKLFDFRDVYLSGGLPTPIGGTEAFLSVNYSNSFCPFTILYPVERSSLPQNRKTVTLAVVLPPDEERWHPLGDYAAQIQAFNMLSRDYEIKEKNYGAYPDPQEALNADIAAGRGPDLVDLSRANTDGVTGWDEEAGKETFTPSFHSDMVTPGVCEDLLPYLRRDLGENALLPGPLAALSREGRLLSLCPSFRVWALAGANSLLNGREPESFTALSELAGDEDRVFYAGVSRESLLHLAFANDKRDWTEEQLRDLLFFAASLNSEKDPEPRLLPWMERQELWTDDDNYLIGMGDVYFGNQRFDLRLFGGPGDWMDFGRSSIPWEEAYFREPIELFPLPGADGLCMQPVGELILLQNAESKEGAWAFLRFLLQDDFLLDKARTGGFVNGIPITRSAYEKGMEAYRERADGTLIINGRTLSYDPENVFRQYDAMLSRIACVIRGEDTISRLCVSESERFFDGEKSLEETASAISQRLRIYLAEQG